MSDAIRRWKIALCLFAVAGVIFAGRAFAGDAKIVVGRPMSPPGWALQERALLAANAEACRQFFAKYFDERGYLLCVERWGGDDGPDDAIENVNDWPILHALGAHDDVLTMYKNAWEGNIRQYTLAKTTDVPFARDGMYYKEFPVMFDWLHNGEGLTVFNLQGLGDPKDASFQARVRRFAGFYMNEDPGAPNYDPKYKIIKSLFNGSRGPLLRKATGVDWAGDPIDVKNRFRLGHGEQSYEQMVAHFKDYNDIVGDNPLNLLATSLAMNAYLLTGEKKYRDWILEYVDAWRARMEENGGIIPSNVGLDGKIGGAADGKWYGGVYGWGFTVEVPQDRTQAHRNHHDMGFVGFMNAYLLTHDIRFLDAWRKQMDLINAHNKMVDGREMHPTMYGDEGWYAYAAGKYKLNALEMYYLSMDPGDRDRVASNGWLEYLEGKNPGYPEKALAGDLARIRERNQALRADVSSPDTRLADDPMDKNPASVQSLIELMLGGLHPGRRGSILHCRLRYFDPIARRAGVPDDVAALVETMTADQLVLTLVNTSPVNERTVTVQAGGYGEHQFVSVVADGQTTAINDARVNVRVGAGCGERLVFTMHRYANQPTLAFPWDR